MNLGQKILCLFFLSNLSLYSMEREIEPADPTREAVSLINQGVFNLIHAPKVGGVISPTDVKIYKERAARDILRGTEILEPYLVNAVEKSTFNRDACLKALKFFGEMHKLALDFSEQNQLSMPEINRPDILFLTLSVKNFLTTHNPPKKNIEEQLIELKEDLFQFLKKINSSPDKSDPRCLLHEAARATTHIIQTPEAMDDYIPHDQFSFKGLFAAATKTGLSFWHHRQQKRVQEKTSEELLKEHDSTEEKKELIDYSLKATEEKIAWTQQHGGKYQQQLADFISPEDDDQADLQEKNLKLIRDGVKFVVHPSSVSSFAGPKTLALVQCAPKWFLNILPESALPRESIDSLKRGKGFKPSDISRISDKFCEEFDISPEKRMEWQEKICSHITGENADLLASTTKKATSLLSKVREHLHKFTEHATSVQQQEDDALNLFKQLVEEDKKWHAQKFGPEEVD